MVARAPSDALDVAAVIRAALVAELRPEEVRSFLDALRALAGQEAGLALRLGMVLACIKQFDLTEIGCSGFLSFCNERVDWGSSWARAIVRLVESPLDRVKAAAAAGHLPLRLAVQAPGKVAVDEQLTWLGAAVLQDPPPSRPRAAFRDHDAEILTRARELARTCLGHDAPLTVLDAFITRHFREHVPGKALDEGRTPPPAPEPRALDFSWLGSAPAEALLGAWRAPTDLADALEQLEAVQAARRSRLSVLARGFTRVNARSHWMEAGYDCVWSYAEHELGWSRRTAQRHHKLGRALQRYPRLDEALREGLPPEAARDIGTFADTPEQCDRVLAVAWHLGPRDLKQALANGGERLEDYERALGLAQKHEDTLLGPDGPTSRPSGVTEVFRVAAEGAASSAGGTAGVAEPAAAAAASTGAAGAGEPARAADPAGAARVSAQAGAAGADGPAEAAGRAGASGPAGASQAAGPAGTAETAKTAETAETAGAAAAPSPSRRRVRLRISLVLPEPEGPDVVYADPELLEAARWFVESNPLPQLSGFAARKAKVSYRCENPECWRRSLLHHTHHIHWVQHGGTDDPDNAVGLCRRCHNGGVHTRDERLRVTRVELEALRTRLWEYKLRTPVLQFLDLPPRPAEPREEAA